MGLTSKTVWMTKKPKPCVLKDSTQMTRGRRRDRPGAWELSLVPESPHRGRAGEDAAIDT